MKNMKMITTFILLLLLASLTSLKAQDRKLKITIGGREFFATLNNNETTGSFIELLPMTINMSEMGGYEKFYYLPQNLPGSASNVGTTYEGDLMIWSSNCLVLFYTTRATSYNYIRLGRLDNTNGLREALGSGSVTVSFEVHYPTVGIDDSQSKVDDYVISPNPVTDYIDIHGGIHKLSLSDIHGRIIKETADKIIYVGDFTPGIYFLKIETDKNDVIIRKLLKN